MKYLYMLKAGESAYKVGIAGDVVDRMKSIQTGNPEKIQLVIATPVNDARQVENQIHKWLSEHSTDGGREWFDLLPSVALRLIIRISELAIPGLNQYLTLRNIAHRQEIADTQIKNLNERMDKITAVPTVAEKRQAQEDALVDEARELVTRTRLASASMLQRRLQIGYARASRLIDLLEKEGTVGPANGSKPREIL